MTRRTGRPGLLRAGLAAVVCLSLAACSTDDPDGPDAAPSASGSPTAVVPTDAPGELATVTYGVFGSPAEVAAYQEVVEGYNAQATTVEVELRSWRTPVAMLRELEAGAELPDLYQVSRNQLAEVIEEERNVPLFSLLEDREVSYGDNYPLDAIEAFSVGDDLQCMPYGISPRVMYVNTDLVDFERMRQRGLPAPADGLSGWDVEQFIAAIEFATRPGRGTRGFTAAETLEGIAPYLYSGGGTLFDDDDEPTALDLSSDDNQESLATLLRIGRNPLTTLTEAQLARATPLEWFARGRLGMLAGDRSITPALRAVPDLDFDVMPMPRLGRTATIGDVTGVCIAPGRDVQRAADFLVHLISPEGFLPVAEAGYVVPANTSVARSDVFLQPDREPANAGVFNASVDVMELMPLAADDPVLRSAVNPLIEELFDATLLPDLEVATAAIDSLSQPIVDPDYEPPLDAPSLPEGSDPGSDSDAPVFPAPTSSAP
jgi:multiple sugar transport system substrate-binding protein